MDPYNRGVGDPYGQGAGDPYNQGTGDPYGRSRGSGDIHGLGAGGGQGLRDPYGDIYRESGGSVDALGRGFIDNAGHSPGYGTAGEGYGAAGDSDDYPSSYKAVPIPGRTSPKNCKGSSCCVPKCFAEKGSRVSIRDGSSHVESDTFWANVTDFGQICTVFSFIVSLARNRAMTQ